MTSIIIGNAFPLSLIRRPVRIEPRPLSELQDKAKTMPCISFWGHHNTLAAAESYVGFSLCPSSERPVIQLTEDKWPQLNGYTFRECWILSPEYKENFRPKVGEEISGDRIRRWEVLRISWD